MIDLNKEIDLQGFVKGFSKVLLFVVLLASSGYLCYLGVNTKNIQTYQVISKSKSIVNINGNDSLLYEAQTTTTRLVVNSKEFNEIPNQGRYVQSSISGLGFVYICLGIILSIIVIAIYFPYVLVIFTIFEL